MKENDELALYKDIRVIADSSLKDALKSVSIDYSDNPLTRGFKIYV